MSDQPDEILTIDDIIADLKAGKRTVYRLAASDKLPASRLGDSGASGVAIRTRGSLVASATQRWMTTRV
jgi:hypothetical protein